MRLFRRRIGLTRQVFVLWPVRLSYPERGRSWYDIPTSEGYTWAWLEWVMKVPTEVKTVYRPL